MMDFLDVIQFALLTALALLVGWPIARVIERRLQARNVLRRGFRLRF